MSTSKNLKNIFFFNLFIHFKLLKKKKKKFIYLIYKNIKNFYILKKKNLYLNIHFNNLITIINASIYFNKNNKKINYLKSWFFLKNFKWIYQIY